MKTHTQTNIQTNYKATSHPHLLSCLVNHKIQEKLWDCLGQTVIQGTLMLTTGSAPSRCITLQTNLAVGRSTVLVRPQDFSNCMRLQHCQKGKEKLVQWVLLSAVTGCNDEEKVGSKTFLGG